MLYIVLVLSLISFGLVFGLTANHSWMFWNPFDKLLHMISRPYTISVYHKILKCFHKYSY